MRAHTLPFTTRDQHRRRAGLRAQRLGISAALAAAAFALVARAVARRDTASADRAATRKGTPSPGHPVRRLADAISPVGKWHSYLPLALTIGGVLRARGPRRGRARVERDAAADAIMLAGVASTVLTRVFDRVLPQPPAPPGHADPTKPVFPSGHAFGPTAVGLTMAYALSRTSLVHPGRAFLTALGVPIVTAGGRFLEERHWLSDIAGGVLGGGAVAALALAFFELRAIE